MTDKYEKKTNRWKSRKKYKRLTKPEVDTFKEENKISISIDYISNDLSNNYIKAGNEGIKHISSKLIYATNLFHNFKDEFKETGDGVWLEYPLLDDCIIKTYQKNKLKYLLSLHQVIEVHKGTGNDIAEVKNLHNLFNSNLKSKLRGKKCLRSLNIKKIVDIAVVVKGAVVQVVEIVVTNKMKKEQKEDMELMSRKGGFQFVEYFTNNK